MRFLDFSKDYGIGGFPPGLEDLVSLQIQRSPFKVAERTAFLFFEEIVEMDIDALAQNADEECDDFVETGFGKIAEI